MALSPETAEGGGRSRPRRAPGLYVQVLAAVAVGIAVGFVRPEWGIALRPLGDGFVKVVKLLVVPLVFTTVSVGIAGMHDLKTAGRTAGKAILWFEAMTTFALVLGIGMAHAVRPGAGMHVSVASIDPSALEKTLSRPHGIADHLLVVVLALAVLTGTVLAVAGERARAVTTLLHRCAAIVFAVVGFVMRFAPLAALGAISFTVGKYGIGTLASLAKLMATFYGAALVFVFVVLGVVMRMLGLSIVRLIAYLREELALVLGTSSSESALARLMGKLEAAGCKPEVVRLVVPTGYSFNLDGTAIYLTLATVFVAQALDVELGPWAEVKLLLVLLLTSKGAAGVTGSGFVTLAATLGTTGTVPVAGLALLLGVDRFMSEARALTNFVGNAVATFVVARWEGALDVEAARRALGDRR